MKARLLAKLLNTERTCSDHGDYIAVGSAYVHDLINVNKKTLKVRYALDTFNEGRKSLLKKDDTELLDIFDKLQSLVYSEEIKDIIDGNDEIENPLPVYTVEEGKLIETFTDKYGWPNVTVDGKLMYDNTWFKTKKKAIEYGIKETKIVIKWKNERLVELNQEIEKVKNDREKYEFRLDELKSIK